MWSKVIQNFWCRGCQYRHKYPSCVACEHKAEFDLADRNLEKAWRALFAPTPLLQSVLYKYPSRWKEEQYRVKSQAIWLSLLYG